MVVEVKHDRYGDASQVVWLLEDELERRMGALVGAEVGMKVVDAVEEDRDSGCEMAREVYALV